MKTREEDVRRSRVCSDCLSSWNLWNVEARSTIVGVALAHFGSVWYFIVVAARKAAEGAMICSSPCVRIGTHCSIDIGPAVTTGSAAALPPRILNKRQR